MSRLARIARTVSGAAAFGVFALAAAGAGAAPADSGVQKYLGYWNLDQPDLATLHNVTVIACPDGGGACDHDLPLPLAVPQVGWVLFTPGPNGTVNGHTDQGCTWNFDVRPHGLELSSTTQRCFNRDIGSAYSITRWSVTVDGTREREVTATTSYQRHGIELHNHMDSGSRTKVTGVGDARSFARFLGEFAYDPADFRTLVNVETTDRGTAHPQRGPVRFTSPAFGTIVAHTPDGCAWTLTVAGDTAELAPAAQTCHTADGDVALRYWAIVTDDGRRLNAFRSGSTDRDGVHANTYLFTATLTRSR